MASDFDTEEELSDCQRDNRKLLAEVGVLKRQLAAAKTRANADESDLAKLLAHTERRLEESEDTIATLRQLMAGMVDAGDLQAAEQEIASLLASKGVNDGEA